MTVGRNDLCPCGSGKKYKKCCLKKENIVQLNEYRQEQFYEQKHRLVIKLREFITEKLPYQDYLKLQSSFHKRFKKNSEHSNDELFHFWLYFFKQYENDLRGIEWFYEENKQRLVDDEKVMAERWTTLTPRLLQAVQETDDAIIFEDMVTKERFSVSRDEENLPTFLPWMSTFALVELFQEHYYFNGVRMYMGPDSIYLGEEKVKELMSSLDKTYEEVCLEHYLDVLAAIINEDDIQSIKNDEQTISEYRLTYEIKNDILALDNIRSIPGMHIENWSPRQKSFSWIDQWQAYEDNELNKAVHLGEVYASIVVEKDKLEVLSLDEQKVQLLKKRLKQLGNALIFKEEKKQTLAIPNVQMKNYVINMPEDTPQFFALYAQNTLIHELDEAIPMFDHLSLREMVERDRVEEVELWLKQSEYNLYRIVLDQFEEVKVTADFNTVRKKLGLALSPFVTGGAKRETRFIKVDLDDASKSIVEGDIPFLERLGFRPDTVDNYYTYDIVRFYKEKTIGKSEATEQKYRNSLFDLREVLERSPCKNWEQCDLSFWERVVTKDYPEIFIEYSKTRRLHFINTIKLLLTWLDKANETSDYREVVEFLNRVK